MSIVLSVATGNIGGALANKLLDDNRSIVVINRDANKVQHLANRGAKVVAGQIDDPAVLDTAFAGAKALFWLLPPPSSPNYTQWGADATKGAVAAARKAGIERVVYISSIGAQGGEATGAIAVHHLAEAAFLSKLPNVTIIRPGFFMENYVRDVASIVASGTVYSPFAGSPYPTPIIAAADIAGRAAAYLTNNWVGQRIVGVHGPSSFTHDEAWAIIGKAIGVPIKTVHVSVEQAEQAMKGHGMPDFLVRLFGDMYRAFTNGVAFQAEPRTPETTSPYTLKEWAEQVFKPAYEAAKQKK